MTFMALSIKNDEADRLARELAARTGETLTDAVVIALAERLERETARARRRRSVAAELTAIRQRCARLPRLDERPEAEILGYDNDGAPA
jgi:antitoxin VapB